MENSAVSQLHNDWEQGMAGEQARRLSGRQLCQPGAAAAGRGRQALPPPHGARRVGSAGCARGAAVRPMGRPPRQQLHQQRLEARHNGVKGGPVAGPLRPALPAAKAAAQAVAGGGLAWQCGCGLVGRQATRARDAALAAAAHRLRHGSCWPLKKVVGQGGGGVAAGWLQCCCPPSPLPLPAIHTHTALSTRHAANAHPPPRTSSARSRRPGL